MELCNTFIATVNTPPPNRCRTLTRRPTISISATTPDSTHHRLRLAETLQNETLETLEWPSLCNQVSAFTSTAMGLAAAQTARLPIGWTPDESRKLLDQTAAAVALPRPLDFSGIEDVSQIVKSSVSGELASISELCAVKRTLRSARELFEKLEELALHDGDSSERYLPLLDILRSCNFLSELEQKIGYCIDCNFSIILDRASEDLEIIRSERKRNTENLDSLLKKVSARIFQGGGIDRPLITKRRSRMCVGIRASHRSLLPDGIVLKISSSGATYFMEPKEAVELNNLEVRLSNSEKVEEQAILSLFTSAIAESNIEIKYLLDRILELDLALARAAHGQWMHGVCPNLTTDGFESYETDSSLLIDIEAIQHPLLLETFLKNSPDLIASKSGSSDPLNGGNGAMKSEAFSDSCDFPVPIDIKVGCSTKVVVISGPNTGGKTASMKTLGLASVMSKAGMYLPAKRQPRLPWFDLILADIGDHQIRDEAEDLDRREAVLMANETRKVKRELKAAKSQIESVIQEFESQLRTTSADQFSSLIKKSESAIASIIEAHCPSDDFSVRETDDNSYTPQIGEQVHVEGLGNKLATVVQALDDDNTVLVQYGKIRIRVNKSNIKALRNKNAIAAKSSVQNMKRQGQLRKNARNLSEFSNDKEVSYGPVVQTSKNTVDLRGMRVEEASHFLNTAISSKGSNSVLFIIHGMGTGVIKECAIEILKNHPRVTKFEQESPMNYGCTVAYIN